MLCCVRTLAPLRLCHQRDRRSLKRSSVRSPPHPIASLPGHLTDQTTRFHPGEVALDGCATGAGQSFGHRGRYKGSYAGGGRILRSHERFQGS